MNFGFSLEIDPNRAGKQTDAEYNLMQLQLVVYKIIRGIQDHTEEFPEDLRSFLLAVRWALSEPSANLSLSGKEQTSTIGENATTPKNPPD